jgi:hypothetical protein
MPSINWAGLGENDRSLNLAFPTSHFGEVIFDNSFSTAHPRVCSLFLQPGDRVGGVWGWRFWWLGFSGTDHLHF